MLEKHNYMKGFIASKTELKVTEKTKYVLYTIAVSNRVKNKETEEYENRTQYFPLIAFNQNAEFLNEHLVKSQHVLIDYRLDTQDVKMMDNTQTIVRLVTNRIEPLESKERGNERQERFLEKKKDSEHESKIKKEAENQIEAEDAEKIASQSYDEDFAF